MGRTRAERIEMEGAWPSGQRVGLAIRWSRVRGPALATCWICSRSCQVQILGHACKWPAVCVLPVGVFKLLHLIYLFLSI